jgi:NtrC-family two-component system response regulator AlgB
MNIVAITEVTVPPLRERRADILPLAEHLLQSFARQHGKAISGLSPPARDALLHYDWPGNIPELRNAIERGVILAVGPLVALADLPPHIGRAEQGVAMSSSPAGAPLTLEELEAEHIRRTLASTASIGEAAMKLGINPSTLYRKRKRYGI